MRFWRNGVLLTFILTICTIWETRPALAGGTPELLFPFVQKQKIGFINKSGKIVIPPKYDLVGYGYDLFKPTDKLLPQAIGTIRDSKWGFIDRTGKFVIEPQYDYVTPFEDGKSKVGILNGQHEFYIGETGKILFSGHTVMGGFDQNGLAVAIDFVRSHANFDEYDYNFINRSGELLSDVSFAGCYDFTEGYAAVNIGGESNLAGVPSGGKWGFIDRNGKFAIKAQFDFAFPFVEGYSAIAVGGKASTGGAAGSIGVPVGAKWGYIDKSGFVIIKPRFQEIGAFSNGVALAKWNNKWGLIDKTGKFTLKPTYLKLKPLGNNMYSFPMDPDENHYGILSKTGRMIATKLTSVGSGFSEGLLPVGWKDSGAFMNAKGQFILKRKGVHYGDFVNGFATYSFIADKKHLQGYMDRYGKYITKTLYSIHANFNSGLAFVVTEDSNGNDFDAYVDMTGRTIWKSNIAR